MHRVAIGFVAVLILSVASASHADAYGTTRADEVTVEVEAGLDGHVGAARAFPVVVDLTADRLFAGTLVVTAETDFGPYRTQLPVEVAATTTKRYVVTVGFANAFGDGRVKAEVQRGRATVGSDDARLIVDQSEELVGVLPGLVPAIDRATVPLALDVGIARLASLPAEVLAEGTMALSGYDQIAAGAGDLDDLSTTDLAAMLVWVRDGGTLMIDAAPGVPLPLPAELVPRGITPVVAGLGRIALTDGALASSRWSEVLLPSATRTQVEEQALNNGMMMSGDVTSALASDAGFRLPEIAKVLLVLALYILLVGPIAWLICRRTGHITRLWVIVPLVAALTTGTLQLVGSDFRKSEGAVHITMVETGPGGGLATTSVFVSSRGSSGSSVELPEGWAPSMNPFVGFQAPRLPVQAVRPGEGSTIPVDPGSGGATVVRVRGQSSLDGALVVTATSDADGVVHGTVLNTLDVDLTEVAVFVSRTAVAKVGKVAHGATEEWTLEETNQFDLDAAPEWETWPSDSNSFGGPVFGPTGQEIEVASSQGSDQVSSVSAYGDVASERGSNFRPPGEVVAVGWTRSLPAPVRVGGRAVRSGRTGVVGRGTVTPAGGRMADPVPVRSLVRGPDTTAFAVSVPPAPVPGSSGPGIAPTTTMVVGKGGGVPGGNLIAAVFAFTLPQDIGGRAVDQARLRAHVPSFYAGLQVWAGSGWVDLPTQPANGGGDVDLPDGAVLRGTVFARILIPIDQPPPSGRELVVFEAPG